MYQSLYRKYRPRNFDEIYGQDVAKKILINSLKIGKISHAYLFFGPRGTGKTSIAKMFARICNCIDSINGYCCEKCENCIESADKNCVDIIEIDAASNNGVDEIRELKNKINLVPNKLKYKVYIVDEVHMLSTGAFNALLKTLEEPPSHVIFILATTEYYKVPSTIVSRCQTVEFKSININNIFSRLKKISTDENISIDDEAITLIAKNSNGGLRDAIGLLDKASSYENNKITSNTIKEIIGTVSENDIDNFFNKICCCDLNYLISTIDLYANDGKDLSKILEDLIEHSMNILLEKEDYCLIDKIRIMNKYHDIMKNSINIKVVFKMMIIELLHKTNVRGKNNLEIKNQIQIKQVEDIKKEKINLNARINNSFVNANKVYLNNVKEKWNELNSYTFDTQFGAFVCDLLDTSPVIVSKTNILLKVNLDSIADKMNSNITVYEEVLLNKLNINQKIAVVDSKKWENLKNEYLKKIKNNIKYEYIDSEEETSVEKSSDLKNDETSEKAKNLFGELLDE